MRKNCITFLILLFCASVCWGQFTMQTQYQHQELVTFPSNIPNCVYGQHNCWHLGSLTANSLSVGPADGYAGALDAAGNAYFHNDYPHNTWTVNSAMGTGAMHNLAIGSASNIYATFSDTAFCTYGGNRIKHWSGTAWTNTNGCAPSPPSVAADGTLAFAWPGSGFYYSTNGGVNWTNPGIGTAFAQAVPVDSNHFIILKTDGSIFTYIVSSNTAVSLVNACCSKISVDENGTIYALRTDGYINRLDALTGHLDQLAGSGFSDIANGGPMNIWAKGPTQNGANLWRFPDQAMMVSTTLTGYTYCNPNCGTAQHTPHAQISWTTTKHVGGLTIYGPTVQADQNIAPLIASDTSWDPFDCFENGSNCNVTGFDGVDCSAKGNNFYSDNNMQEELPDNFAVGKVTHQRLIGPPSDCSPTLDRKSNWCWYPVVVSCPNPGPYLFNEVAVRARQDVADAPPPGGPIEYWIALHTCVHYPSSGWTCIPLGIDLPRVVNPNTPCSTLANP